MQSRSKHFFSREQLGKVRLLVRGPLPEREPKPAGTAKLGGIHFVEPMILAGRFGSRTFQKKNPESKSMYAPCRWVSPSKLTLAALAMEIIPNIVSLHKQNDDFP